MQKTKRVNTSLKDSIRNFLSGKSDQIVSHANAKTTSLIELFLELREQIANKTLDHFLDKAQQDPAQKADCLCDWISQNQALLSKIDVIHLNVDILAGIPDEIVHFSNLQELDLSGN